MNVKPEFPAELSMPRFGVTTFATDYGSPTFSETVDFLVPGWLPDAENPHARRRTRAGQNGRSTNRPYYRRPA
jgi:hypothetical protein